jgi:tetratricopeptide (TPR) repeat protein
LRFLFAQALLQRGNPGGARTQLIEAIRRNPAFLEAHLLLADIALRQGQMNESLQHTGDAITLDRDNFRARFIRGSALLGLGNLDQAASVFSNLLRDAPASVDVRLQLAFLENRKRNFAGAEAAYRKILDTSPREWRAVAGLVQIYSDQKQLDRALKMLEAELQHNPGVPEVLSMLADTALKAGRYDLAIEQYNQLATARPRSIDPLIQLGEVYRQKGDFNNAITALQKAAAMQPSDVRPPFLLAALLEQANRREEAKTQCRRALSLRPDDIVLMNNLADLLAETGDNLDEALKLAQRAVDKAPSNPQFSDTLGWVYTKKGMSDNAVQIFRKLVQQHSDSPTFSFHLGVALFQKGEVAEARLQLGRALELQPSSELKKQISDTLSQLN